MDTKPFIRLAEMTRHFGAVKALRGVDIDILPGRMLSIVGHNGAGKSTLMQIIAGVLPPSSGVVEIDGQVQSGHYDVRHAQTLGIRCVFQELSLCPNLSLIENTRILHQSLTGFSWRNKAKKLICDSLDRIFPGHGINPYHVIGTLSIGQRQMVEIARAFTETDEPIKLVLLDEATASLDAAATRQLLDFTRRAREAGIACIFISHRLKEIIDYADDVVVLRDGTVIGAAPAAKLKESDLIEMMGDVHNTALKSYEHAKITGPLLIESKPNGDDLYPLQVHRGEIVGLAGLAGHGQRECLHHVFSRSTRRKYGISVQGRVAYVSGDRAREGVFPLWSVARNMSIGAMRQLTRHGFISSKAEKELSETWKREIDIKTPNLAQLTVRLSGGNQQKILVARALAAQADILLLDDPMRGVDVGTKVELYERMRQYAASGHAVLWYTTENSELTECDRIFVYSLGRITDMMERQDYSEERVIRASFIEKSSNAN